MLSFKILCKIIKNGRVTIPLDIRKTLKIKEGDLVQIEISKNADGGE